MPRLAANAPRWNGRRGHFEVGYLTLADAGSGVGISIRYTTTAPLHEPASAAVWFVATDPPGGILARKQVRPIGDFDARGVPFELRIADAVLSDERMAGEFDDVAGTRGGPIPDGPTDIPIPWRSGSAWPRACSSFHTPTSPSRESSSRTGAATHSRGGASRSSSRDARVVVEVDADREQLAGVTYHDPDGAPAYCYNTEAASIRLHLYERARRVGDWAYARTLQAHGRAHFEYAQRKPVPDLELRLR